LFPRDPTGLQFHFEFYDTTQVKLRTEIVIAFVAVLGCDRSIASIFDFESDSGATAFCA